MRVACLGLLAFLLCGASPPWVSGLRKEIARIDAETPGAMGVYVLRLSDGARLGYRAGRKWYLASTIKVPVAIALLQRAEQGGLALDEQVTLQKADYVDGSGEANWAEPGTAFTLGRLLELMLVRSDSTATDLLIRRLGVDELNRKVTEWTAPAGGFAPITSLLQVRYDAYGELHPRARELSNMDFFEFKKAKEPKDRLPLFLARLKLERSDLEARDVEAAFERYYARGLNSASLEAFGGLLARLARGELLSPEGTARALGLMEGAVTGENRIKAGLGAGLAFAQKTGTQVRRICNVGIVRRPPAAVSRGAVVAACLERFKEPEQAEAALERLGRAIARSGLP